MANRAGMPVNQPELHAFARKFFDEFVEAFRSFDGATIALRYLSPYLAFHTHGSAEVFLSSTDTAAYFQRIVDEYHAKGCRSCRYDALEVFPLGPDCAVATVTWELLAEDLSVLGAWRESYNLCLVEGRFLVFTSTDHVVQTHTPE
jgi:hypothetical protein